MSGGTASAPPPPIDFDELRKTVALRHNIVLPPDDPVLVTVALNEVVLTRYIDLLHEQNRRYQRELSAAIQSQIELAKEVTQTQIEAAKQIVEQTITKGADYVAQQVCPLVKESIKKTVEEANWAAISAGICALVAALASVMILIK